MYNYTPTNIIMILAVTCDLPTQLLNFLVAVVSGSQDRPPIEGQFITYTCPSGFVPTGPNTSVCTGNREWEPDPGHVICIGNYYACTQGPKAQNWLPGHKIWLHNISIASIIIHYLKSIVSRTYCQ